MSISKTRFVQTLATVCLSFPFQTWSWEGLFKNLENGWRPFDQFPNPPKASKNLFRTLSQNGSLFWGATVHVQNPAIVEMAILRYLLSVLSSQFYLFDLKLFHCFSPPPRAWPDLGDPSRQDSKGATKESTFATGMFSKGCWCWWWWCLWWSWWWWWSW